ncbi:hypothetical protein COU37_03880 [Candidatus Micrarchaeota archaeon CG10_big_fil_rev_8_21_14_0_10_45_29]|nr:MAG: hypothetical protein COU37_03880 [Candidatus Micrarchaeota archaeon CG10_big_fil_rev_8_21_14_0_10_45_29]
MGLEDFLISTGVDNLIQLVHTKGRIELREAASELRMPVTTIEDWAKTLEEEGLIKIEYKITNIFLVWAQLSNEKYSEKKKEIGIGKKEALSKLEAMKRNVDENLGQIEGIGAEFEQMQGAVSAQAQLLAGDLEEARALGVQAQKIVEEKKLSLQQLRSELGKARGELLAFEANAKNIKTDSKKGESPQELMKALEKASAEIEAKVNKTASGFEQISKKINEMRIQVDEQKGAQEMAQMRQEMDDLKFARSELLKSAKSFLIEVKEMGERMNSLDAKYEQMLKGKEGISDPAKLRQEVEGLYKTAVADSQEIMGKLQNDLATVRSQIQEYSKVSYTSQNLQAHLSGIQAQYEKESGELDTMLNSLERAQKKYDEDLKKTTGALGERKEEYEKLIEKGKRIEMMLSNVNELNAEGQKLSTKLKGLMMEAQVVDMAAPNGAKAKYAPAKKGLWGKYGGKLAGSGGRKDSGGVQKSPVMGSADNSAANSRFEADEASAGRSALPASIVEKISKSEKEEKEFEKKREELRWLIHKMWDEEKGNSASA